MGVENGDSHYREQLGNRPPQRAEFDHVDSGPVRHTPATELANEQVGGEAGAVPVEVFNRMTQLEQQLAEAQAKLEHQRELGRARDQRWRQNHPDEVKKRARERMAAYRARRRQQGL